MQRNEETLSTRDLASTSDPATGAAPASDLPPVPGEQSGEAPATVYDREATDGERANREATDYETVDREATDYETVDREAASGASLGADTTARNTGSQAVGSAPGRATDPASPAGPASSATLSITFQRRWEEVQTRFVDEPRGAVEDADGLVANLMQQLAEGFAQERERLEAQWGRGEDISTEDLRIALQRYRSFFQRLLST